MEWQPIETAPDDFEQGVAGQRTVMVKDRTGKEFKAKRGYFNNSGWHEIGTNREIWPTHWQPLRTAQLPFTGQSRHQCHDRREIDG